MGDFRIFRLSDAGAEELGARSVPLERDLQSLIEKNMETCLGVKFLAREYSTGRLTRGSVDSLGLDANFRPVVIEYKRGRDENVVTQALYYLDWLLDHQAEFVGLAAEKLDRDSALKIDFFGARIICVASAFSRFDEGAIRQIGRDIELVRYKLYGPDLLALETLKSPVSPFLSLPSSGDEPGPRDIGMPPAMQTRVRNMNAEMELIYLELLSFAETLGEDVTIRFLKHYIALGRRRHFTCLQPLKNILKLWVNLDPAEIDLADGFGRDVTNLGHHATGNLEIDIHSREDLERAKPIIELAYQKN